MIGRKVMIKVFFWNLSCPPCSIELISRVCACVRGFVEPEKKFEFSIVVPIFYRGEGGVIILLGLLSRHLVVKSFRDMIRVKDIS